MAAARVSALRTTLTIPTYTRFPSRRLPLIFRESYGNIYPDTRDDVLGGPKKNVKYDAIVLENEYLRVTILPGLGGKIWSVFDKKARQETLHVPDCVKPGMVYVCGAWIAGGMEINFPVGHHVDSMSPLPARIEQTDPDQAVAVVERTDRRSGLRMEARTILRAGEACFDLSITVSNPTSISQRWYQWTNVGVLASPEWRFFTKGNLYTGGMDIDSYPVDRSGRDISWYRNRYVAGDNFMIGLREDFFGCYDYGRQHGLAHVAPWEELRGKKYFTWGSSQRVYDSGRNLNDRGDDYLEIQTGPMETQSDFALLAPGQSRRFTGTWMPYAKIGGIEWACRDVLLNVQDGAAWLYATKACEVALTVNGRTVRERLQPGEPVRLRARVKEGDDLAVAVNGRPMRRWTYPLKGRMEPQAKAKFLKRTKIQGDCWAQRKPRSARHALEMARQWVLWDFNGQAVANYRQALRMKQDLHQARLELAETLFRMGEFKAGRKELALLAGTRYASQAEEMLARGKAAEQVWMAPVLAQPKGVLRDLALAERLAGYDAHAAAFRIYQKLLKTAPRNPRVHYGLAMYYFYAKRDRPRAVEHADKALRYAPGDRDYLIELLPVYVSSGKPQRVLEEFAKAAPKSRSLAILLKCKATALWETGEFRQCWDIISTNRLHNWEGEMGHVQVFVDATLALVEQALAKGDVAEARAKIELAKHLDRTPTLGVLRDCGGGQRQAYWDGLVALHEGKRDEAERIWRAVVEPAAKIKRIPLDISEWRLAPHPENEYMRVMCAIALGDAKMTRHAIGLLRRLRDDWVKQASEHRPAPTALLDGMVAELEGDFAAAARHLEKFIATEPYTRLARMHLEAVQAGRKRGEVAPPALRVAGKPGRKPRRPRAIAAGA